MYKNQLQELAQRSCFNLPAYSCIREGPDHAPRFKATVNFNGEPFESPNFCTTLRQAEHAAAEVALIALARRGPSQSLAARVLDETGVYKNLLQETAHRAGLNLPVYTTVRSGPGHTPVFTCTVELAGMSFTGDPAKTKKQAQKNAAIAAWSSLKQLPHLEGCSSSSSSSLLETEHNEEQEQVIVARALTRLHSPGGSKPIQHNDRLSGRPRQLPVWREANVAKNVPVQPVVPCQGWMHSNFLPDVSMYQTWPQDSYPRQQGHFLTHPLSAPNELSSYLQTSMQNTQGQYFRLMGQNFLGSLPSYVEARPMYFPVFPPCPPEDRYLISMQETQEEESVQETGWFPSSIASGVNPINCNNVIRTGKLDRNFEVSDRSLPAGNTSKPRESECLDQQVIFPQNASEISHGSSSSNSSFRSGGDISSVVCDPSSSENMRGTSRQEVKRDACKQMNGEAGSTYQSSSNLSFVVHNTGRSKSTGIVLHPPDTSSSGQLQHRADFSTSRRSCRTGVRNGDFRSRIISMAPPVTIRTATPVCSARPGGSNSKNGGSSSNVPSVHIRTVQPVFSSPDVRSVSSVPVQRRTQEPETISTATSDFSKLQI